MTARSNVSRIPANAPKPQDHRPRKAPVKKAAAKTAAAKARQAEAADGFVAIEQCGITLQIPVGDKMPLDAFLVLNGDEEALSRLKVRPEDAETAGLRLLLGPEQWSAFVAARPTLGDFAEIGRQLEELTGN